MIRKFINPNTNQTQLLAVEDIRNQEGLAMNMIKNKTVRIVYSDPPWGPITEKNWRKDAGVAVYNNNVYYQLIEQWAELISHAQGVQHVFCQQSSNQKYRDIFDGVMARSKRWRLPLVQEWQVFYGTPGRMPCTKPNFLLHFGTGKIDVDPTGLTGINMAATVFKGLEITSEDWIFDPCMGIGLTSRLAHLFGANCIGSELSEKRLSDCVKWLLKQGYEEHV